MLFRSDDDDLEDIVDELELDLGDDLELYKDEDEDEDDNEE